MTERVVGQLVESNVFLFGNEHECLIVDAGVKPEFVKEKVAGRKVLGILLTHGHYDHCFYVLDYVKEFGCKVYGSSNLKTYLKNPRYNYSDGKLKIVDFKNFIFLKGNGEIKLGDSSIEYTQLGGHSKSDMCFQIDDEIFVGDVLIGRDMGRLDLYGGNKDEMKKSLEHLLALDYSVMHSGHGEDNSKASQDKVARLWLRYLSR